MTTRELWSTLQNAAGLSGMVLLLVAVANSVATSAALASVPQNIAATLASWHLTPDAFLIITVFVMILAGALLEGVPAILVFGPLLVPVAQAMAINIVHFGVVFILALGVGAFSPILGIGFYAACSVMRADVGAASRLYVPYFVAMVIAIILIALLPVISTALPSAFGLNMS